jgi:hypothetical protein
MHVDEDAALAELKRLWQAQARHELLAEIDAFLRASHDWEGKPDRVAMAWADVVAANFDAEGQRP